MYAWDSAGNDQATTSLITSARTSSRIGYFWKLQKVSKVNKTSTGRLRILHLSIHRLRFPSSHLLSHLRSLILLLELATPPSGKSDHLNTYDIVEDALTVSRSPGQAEAYVGACGKPLFYRILEPLHCNSIHDVIPHTYDMCTPLTRHSSTAPSSHSTVSAPPILIEGLSPSLRV